MGSRTEEFTGFGPRESSRSNKARQFLTIREVAAILGVAPRTVRSWIDKGLLQATILGERSVRISRAELSFWIDVQQREPSHYDQ
jgi:excisionase family DNA binding protein